MTLLEWFGDRLPYIGAVFILCVMWWTLKTEET